MIESERFVGENHGGHQGMRLTGNEEMKHARENAARMPRVKTFFLLYVCSFSFLFLSFFRFLFLYARNRCFSFYGKEREEADFANFPFAETFYRYARLLATIVFFFPFSCELARRLAAIAQSLLIRKPAVATRRLFSREGC